MFESIHKSGVPLFLLGVAFSALIFRFVSPGLLVSGLTGLFFTLTAIVAGGLTLMMLITRVTSFPEAIPSDYVIGAGVPAVLLLAVLLLSDIPEAHRFAIMAYAPALGGTFYVAAVLVFKSANSRN